MTDDEGGEAAAAAAALLTGEEARFVPKIPIIIMDLYYRCCVHTMLVSRTGSLLDMDWQSVLSDILI